VQSAGFFGIIETSAMPNTTHERNAMNTKNSMKPTELLSLAKGTSVWAFADGANGLPSVCRVIYLGTDVRLRFITSDKRSITTSGVLRDGTTGFFRTAAEAAAALAS
jgi:hypothetical protein